MRGCDVAGCARPFYCRGWCQLHYYRWRSHGTTDDPRPAPEQRFWAKVNKTEGCWLWTASRTHEGYGMFSIQGRRHYAQRVAWMLTYGLIPEGMLVLHRCDNPPCCRPDHLFLGTHADNMADMATKGRHAAKGRSDATWLGRLNLSKTRCKRGHPFDEANTVWRPNGSRLCRACDRIRGVQKRARRRALQGLDPQNH